MEIYTVIYLGPESFDSERRDYFCDEFDILNSYKTLEDAKQNIVELLNSQNEYMKVYGNNYLIDIANLQFVENDHLKINHRFRDYWSVRIGKEGCQETYVILKKTLL